MLRCRPRAVAAATTLALIAAGAATAAPPTPLGAATPQALVERMLGAAKTENIGEMVACLDPQSRHEVSLGLVAGTTMIVAFMGMGADMAGGMAEGMGEAVSGQKMKPEDKAKLEKGKAEAKAKMAKAKTGLSAILKKYGLPDFTDEKAKLPEKADAAAMMQKVDEPALVTDLFAFMGTIGDPKETKEGKKDVPIPELKDVKDYKISGDKATAKSSTETLEFVKVGDRWFFHPPDKKDKTPVK